MDSFSKCECLCVWPVIRRIMCMNWSACFRIRQVRPAALKEGAGLDTLGNGKGRAEPIERAKEKV